VPKNKLSKDVIDSWPEILEDIDIQVVPIEYLDSIRVSFVDGKIWDIDIAKSIKNGVDFDIEDALEDIFDEYQDSIAGVDFRLDTEKVKRDIKNRTAQFLKKRK
jgi:hypothetical protein